MATYDSYLPSPAQTPAYPHDSPFLRLHSYAPSASSLPPTPSSSTSPSPPAELELEVLCSLFTDALSDPSLGGSSQAMPKTIRVSFGSLPLATKVAQAPPGSIAQQHDEDDDQPKQSLQLRCKIPTREQVVKSGTVVEEDGKVALYCELIARTPQKEDSVVDRVWFGDFDFNGTDNVDGFAVQRQSQEVLHLYRDHIQAEPAPLACLPQSTGRANGLHPRWTTTAPVGRGSAIRPIQCTSKDLRQPVSIRSMAVPAGLTSSSDRRARMTILLVSPHPCRSARARVPC